MRAAPRFSKQPSLPIDRFLDNSFEIAFLGPFARLDDHPLLRFRQLAPRLEKLGMLIDQVDRFVRCHTKIGRELRRAAANKITPRRTQRFKGKSKKAKVKIPNPKSLLLSAHFGLPFSNSSMIRWF
jgi:hypothetical protein